MENIIIIINKNIFINQIILLTKTFSLIRIIIIKYLYNKIGNIGTKKII